MGVTYSYVSGDFEKFPALCGTNQPQTCIDTDNLAKRSAPGNQFSVSADYLLARTEIGNLRGYVQANWQDEWIESALWTAVVGGEPVVYDHIGMDERTIVNARLSLEDVKAGPGNLSFTLWGKNLTDDDHPTFGINFGSLGPVTQVYGEPRTYGLDVTYEY